MDDINKFTDDNLGGIYLFKFTPADDVQSISEPIDGFITKEISLKPDARWFDFYGTEGTMQFSEEDANSNDGALYNKKLTAITPKQRTELDQLFYKMRNRRFILDVIDNNGLRKIVGSIEEPLKFSNKGDTKNQASGRNEYAIEFACQSTFKSYTYDI